MAGFTINPGFAVLLEYGACNARIFWRFGSRTHRSRRRRSLHPSDPAAQTAPAGSSRDQPQGWKIRPISRRVASEKCHPADGRVGADVKVRQGRASRPAPPPVVDRVSSVSTSRMTLLSTNTAPMMTDPVTGLAQGSHPCLCGPCHALSNEPPPVALGGRRAVPSSPPRCCPTA